MGVNIILVAKLVGSSPGCGRPCSPAHGGALFALLRVRAVAERRVGRFVRGGEIQQTQALYNVGLVVMVVVLAGCGLAAVLVKVLT